MTSEQERLARAGLMRITEPGDGTVFDAVQAHGAVEVWEALRLGVPVGRVSQGVLPGILGKAEGHDPQVDLDAAQRCGARLVCPGDPEWPALRLTWKAQGLLDCPPLGLWVRGRLPLEEVVERSVGVVGARAATSYGLYVAGDIAAGLAERAATVVSGGAYGIDAAAHRGALAASGAPTVAVLACGVDVYYPRGNDRMLAAIAEDGLLVSELPPGSHPTRKRFLVRNRLIAALSLGTVVVEAAARSGSLATLERARLLNRHVMAVPGSVTSSMSTGCNEEIRQGATCVTRAEEVLELVGRLGEDSVEPRRGPVDVRDALSATVRQVLDALPVRGSAGVGVIARSAGVSPLVVQQVLPPLVAHGLVLRTDEGWRLTPLGAGKPRAEAVG
jgi:DNA processing protein